MQNHLVFNLKKCSVSEFRYGRNKKTLKGVCFFMEGRDLNHKSLVRDVGLFIDESLNWNEHVKKELERQQNHSVEKKYHADHLHPD